MPDGKPAGVPCVQLTKDRLCKVYDKPERPAVCASYQAREEFCGTNEGEAMRLLDELELMTGAAGGNEGKNPIHG
jgi:Fe-S-cluster containining protein